MRNAVACGKMKLAQAVTATKLTLLIIKEVTLNLPFIYSKLTSINILVNQLIFFILCSYLLHSKSSLKVSLYTLIFYSIIGYVLVSLKIRKWVKLPQITRRLDNRNSQ